VTYAVDVQTGLLAQSVFLFGGFFRCEFTPVTRGVPYRLGRDRILHRRA
jgi:hypothetical protein